MCAASPFCSPFGPQAFQLMRGAYGGSASARLPILCAGEYVLDGNPNSLLLISPDKITSKMGPVSFSSGYVLKSVEGKNVSIEMGSTEPKEMLLIHVERDVITVRGTNVFAGEWKRKLGNPQ